MKRTCVLLSVFLLCFPVGCGESDSLVYEKEALASEFLSLADEVIIGEDGVSFTDGTGQAWTVASAPERVYSLYASFTTLWYEAGGTVAGCIGGALAKEAYFDAIGRDVSEDEGMTILSEYTLASKWNVEGIVAGKPDLILCSTAMNGYATIAPPAEALGIPVIAVDYDDFKDYLKWFKVFCNLTERPDLWESVALPALEEVVELLLELPKESPSVLCLFSGSVSLQANLSTTVLGGMIKSLHADNVADGFYNASGATRLPVNLETVYAADPDLILVQCHASEEENRLLVEREYGDNPVWNALSAVREGRVYYLEKKLFHNKPNRRFAEAYRTLAEILYPQAFGDQP